MVGTPSFIFGGSTGETPDQMTQGSLLGLAVGKCDGDHATPHGTSNISLQQAPKSYHPHFFFGSGSFTTIPGLALKAFTVLPSDTFHTTTPPS